MQILKHILTKSGSSPIVLETGITGLMRDLSQL